MESLAESQFKKIINFGREFAYEGMDPLTFKSEDPEELEAFIQGYTEGHLLNPSLMTEEKYQEVVESLQERVVKLRNKEHSANIGL